MAILSTAKWTTKKRVKNGRLTRELLDECSTLKPRLHMAHFKRTRPGTEPGSVPGPVTRLFTLSGPGTAPTRSSPWPPLICAMQCVCSSLFLDFDDVTELQWPVCATTKMITLIYFILLFSRIFGAIQQTNSRRGAWSFLRFCILGKNKLKNGDGLSEIMASNSCASQCELSNFYNIHVCLCREHLNKLIKSINSKRLAATQTQHRRILYSTTT